MVGGHYIGPYTGSAGVTLELLLEDLVSHIHLNDSSPPIYAFWNSVLHQPDGGIAQTGTWNMDARFPRNELVRRIELIASRRDAVTLRNCDAEAFILGYIPGLPSETLVYCDPPYFAKSNRLYLDHYQRSDHARVEEVIQRDLPRRWVVSYDSAPEISTYYSGRRAFTYRLQYSAS